MSSHRGHYRRYSEEGCDRNLKKLKREDLNKWSKFTSDNKSSPKILDIWLETIQCGGVVAIENIEEKRV